ncbi:MAG: Crp/Fnr family transcriptional regulator [Clostridia bacterium]|nr:Crp/Fnr family transcriptional regulator [Clostridia bacterium]
MNSNYLPTLLKCQLFKEMHAEEIERLCDQYKGRKFTFQKGEIIVDEGDHCDSISILLNGTVELHTFFISGDIASLITLSPGDIFGEAVIFSPVEEYPISALSITDTEILRLSKKDILNLMEEYPQILENYLALLSKKLLFLNDKFKLLSLSTIRGKIAHVLIKLSKEQKSMTVKLPFSKEKMALHICTRRPSLSRELGKMKSEGLIDFDKSIITILDYDTLSAELF